jgi:hypothetical protein
MRSGAQFRQAWLSVLLAGWLLAGTECSLLAADLPLIESVESQPLVSATERLLQTLEFVGAPLNKADTDALRGGLLGGRPQPAVGTHKSNLY